MPRRIVLAMPEPQYAAKLARYLKERRPDWEVAAFTQEAPLRRQMAAAGGAEAVLAHASLLAAAREAAAAAGSGCKLIVLAERAGDGGGLPELAPYQPLSVLAAELESLLAPVGGDAGRDRGDAKGARIWTVFSASGGAGKTAAALNLVRQAGERGYRVCYLNLEPLNATDLLLGSGEPDALSRLLYSLQNRPDQAPADWERLRRRHTGLQAEYVDAPELPAERLSMTPERVRALLEFVSAAGSYDLIVVDPDSGCGDWHRELLAMSGRVVWLAPDDVMAIRKADKLLRSWQDRLPGAPGHLAFVINKAAGGSGNCRPPLGAEVAARLPYVPQWKSLDQPERLLQSPAFSGAIDRLLDALGLMADPPRAERRGGAHGRERTVAGRIG